MRWCLTHSLTHSLTHLLPTLLLLRLTLWSLLRLVVTVSTHSLAHPPLALSLLVRRNSSFTTPLPHSLTHSHTHTLTPLLNNVNTLPNCQTFFRTSQTHRVCGDPTGRACHSLQVEVQGSHSFQLRWHYGQITRRIP